MKDLKLINKMVFIILDIIAIAIAIVIFYITIPLDIPKDLLNRVIKLPKGSATNTIKSLQKQGFKLSMIDTYLLVLIGQPKVGDIKIKDEKINRIDFLHKLTTSAIQDFNRVTLIPGETKVIFFKNIAKKYGLDFNKLNANYLKYSPYPEAGIVPDTYHIPIGTKEEKLISFLVKSSEKRYEQLAIKELQRYDKKEWLLYLIIASIIQKEAGNIEEMPKISSVIYNRLKKDMPLQMDGTLNYGEYSHTKVTPKRIREDKSRFNTYLNKGLPPYPICSVSIDAIKSALHPNKSNYLFFMKNRYGVHDFSQSYEEHLKNIERAKKR
jgi:UPF0755 protein